MRRRPGVLLAVAGCLLLAGCWSRYELDQRAIVSATAVDVAEEPGQLRLSVLLTRAVTARSPAATGGSAPRPEDIPWVISATGRTPAEAVRNLEEHSERRLFFTHNLVIVIGEGLARAGVRPALEFLERHPEVRLRNWVLATRGRPAREILQVTSRLDLVPMDGLFKQVQTRRLTGTAGAVDLREFMIKLTGTTTAPVAAVITPVPRPSTADPVGPQPARPGFQLSGTAVFRGDRLAGYLDPDDTRGLLWASGQLQTAVVTVPCPQQPQTYASVLVERATARTQVRWSGQWPRVRLLVRAEGDLQDYRCPADPLRPGVWAALEQALADTIADEIRSALDEARQWQADVFGFGEAVHRAFPAAWPRLKPGWPEIFADLQVDLAVEARLRRIGTITRPPAPPAESLPGR